MRYVYVVVVILCCFTPLINAEIQIDGQMNDWKYEDLKALDEYWGMTLGINPSDPSSEPITLGGIIQPVGTDQTYLFNDGWDDSRDIVAFYMRHQNDQIFFRVDLFDLALGAENGNLDLYVMIDCDSAEGESWLPDFTDCQTSAPWDVAICVYDSTNYDVKDGAAGQPSLGVVIDGPAYNAQFDAIEWGISRQVLIENGWDGASPYQLQVFTTKDGTDGGAGEIVNHSDIADSIADDDRGFSDGILNGTISSSDEALRRAHLVVQTYANQPLYNERRTREQIDRSQDPFYPVNEVGMVQTINVCEKTELPIEIHLTVPFAYAIQWADPDFSQRLGEAIAEGTVDLMGGAYSDHILTFLHGDITVKSIGMAAQEMASLYDWQPASARVFWVPERTARGDFTTDILTANSQYSLNFQGTVLDGATHHRDWFAYDHVWDGVPGNEVLIDNDSDIHKLHNYAGLKLAFSDRYTEFWLLESMGPGYSFYGRRYEPSLHIGVRAKLLDLALHNDRAQALIAVFPWELLAGQPAGRAPSSRNPDGFRTAFTWIAAHPWINATTLNRILSDDVDITGDGIGDPWPSVTDPPLIDHLPTYYGLPMPPYWLDGVLPLNSPTRLRDAAEGNFGDDNPYPDPANTDDLPENDDWDDGYQNWWAGSNWEWSLINTVPAQYGWQYSRSTEGTYPANPIPNGSIIGTPWIWNSNDASESPGSIGLIPQAWTLLQQSASPNTLTDLAFHVFMCSIWKAGWHDEATVRARTGQPQDDDTKGIITDSVMAAIGHIRDVAILTRAAEWAESNPNQTTITEQIDIDIDGESEWVMRNNRLFLVFEDDGGRLVRAFSRDANSGEVYEIVGASGVAPDWPGEDEGLDHYVSNEPDVEFNRASCFRESGYVNQPYLVNIANKDLLFYTQDLKIKRRISLPDNSDYINVKYELNRSTPLLVEHCFSPNPRATMLSGKAVLQEIGSPYDEFIGIRNIYGGAAYIEMQDAEFVARDNLDARATLPLAQRFVISVQNIAQLRIGFGNSWEDRPPQILGVRIFGSPMDSRSGGELRIEAITNGPPPERVRLLYAGSPEKPLTPPLYLFDLADDGTAGDRIAGDGIYSFAASIPAGTAPQDRYILAVDAQDAMGNDSNPWPFFTVTGDTATSYSSADIDDLVALKMEPPHNQVGLSPGSPYIPFGAYLRTHVSQTGGGNIRCYVQIEDPDGPSDVFDAEVCYAGIRTGIYLTSIGNSFWAFELEMPPGIPAGDYLLGVEARDIDGNRSNLWPTWHVR